MKPLRILIIVSIATNVTLAGWWIKSKRTNTSSDSSAETSQSNSNSRQHSGASSSAATESESAAAISAAATGPITTWLDIQSADLKQLVRRLREASCPDETVKDIILAEVNRRFAVRHRELWPERYQDEFKYWKVENRNNDPVKLKTNRELQRKDRELQKEKSAQLVELLGVDPEKQQRIEDGSDENFNWQERQVAFLPESKRAAAQKILDDFQDKQQEMYAANSGIHDAQSRAEQRQLEADKLAALAQILSPSELRDYELRQSQTATLVSYNLNNTPVSREEYEAIFDIRKKYGDSINNYGDLQSKEERNQVQENIKSMKAELATTLGPEKFKEYERGTDSQYQQLTRLAKKNDLPADTAGKVFDFTASSAVAL